MSSPQLKRRKKRNKNTEENSIGDESFQLYNESSDVFDDGNADDDEDVEPTRKKKDFEFSNNIKCMRLVRTIIYLQIIAISIDTNGNDVKIPLLFNIISHGPIFYSIRFYSRPFADIIYIIQYFLEKYWSSIAAVFTGNFRFQQISPPDTNQILGDSVRRSLGNSNYAYVPPNKAIMAFDIDVVDSRNWHSIVTFSHFFLGIAFAVLAVILLLFVWEISDYTITSETLTWLQKYVAGGWWRRGGFSIVVTIIKVLMSVVLLVAIMYIFARGANNNAMPTSVMFGSVTAIVLCISIVVSIFGYLLLYLAESSFVKYVSQNILYSSRIILKKVMKVKIEMGLIFMITLYTPVLYNLTQSLVYYMDWNDAHALPHRVNINYHVPCYIMAFPPYRKSNLPYSSCSAASATLDLPLSTTFGEDMSILQCDTYLGITFYLIGTTFFSFFLCSYLWIILSLTMTAASEVRSSHLSEDLRVVLDVQKMQLNHYCRDFGLADRVIVYLEDEVKVQLAYVASIPHFILDSTLSLVYNVSHVLLTPVAIAVCILKLLSKRMLGIRYSMQASVNDIDDDRDNHTNRSSPSAIILSSAWVTIAAILPIEIISVRLTSLSQMVNKSQLMADIRINIHFTIEFVKHCGRAHTISGIGSMSADKHANWRVNLTMRARNKALKKVQRQLDRLLHKTKVDIIYNHDLIITCFDRIIDMSGLSMLVNPYKWYRLEYMIAFMMEITIYAIVSVVASYYFDWIYRCIIIVLIDVFFGVVTYLTRPYMDDTDAWLDSLGRTLIVIVLVGSIVCNSIMTQLHDSHRDMYAMQQMYMYTPWKSFGILMHLSAESGIAGVYMMIDVVMVLSMYAYVFYILKDIGLFREMGRYFDSIKFALHDQILEYLVKQLEQRQLGFNNIYTGLVLLQQWDDVIREQRRYALVTWPSIRPSHTVSAYAKLVYIKWASIFNLNIANLRSSLGLTLLHTSMFTADCEVVRWLVYMHPQLLKVQDAQNDTPLMVALKECSKCLLAYAQKNSGCLDDSTSYSDSSYEQYYPEILSFRDACCTYGEFDESMCIEHLLIQEQLNRLDTDGYFETTAGNRSGNSSSSNSPGGSVYSVPSFYDKIIGDKEKANAKTRQMEIAAQLLGSPSISSPAAKGYMSPSEVIAKERQKAEYKARQARKAEQMALVCKRFPEDDECDNFEYGRVSAWEIVRLSVPSVTLYRDRHVVTQQMQEMTQHSRDLIRNIQTSKEIAALDDNVYIPESHDKWKGLSDWDCTGEAVDEQNIVVHAFNQLHRFIKHTLLQLPVHTSGVVGNSSSNDDDDEPYSSESRLQDVSTAMKIFRYAEILLSEEIKRFSKDTDWDINSYKELNKLSNVEYGRLCQNLTMACNLNPPDGFARISEWTQGHYRSVYDEHDHADRTQQHSLVRATVNTIESAATTIHAITSVVTGNFINRNRHSHSGSSTGGRTTSADKLRHDDETLHTSGFSDRVIQYLSECMVASTTSLNLDDCELSEYGKVGFRAICRALRRENCTFILPSVIVSPKKMCIKQLILTRNELDCGDCVLIADALLYQQSLELLDLSYNRIGGRGFGRICKILKTHDSLRSLKVTYNRIGPTCGKDVGDMLRNTCTLEYLDMSYNRMGDLTRYPTDKRGEKVVSVVRSLFFVGMRSNKSIHRLDVSYNNLGSALADYVPLSICKHPCLYSLDLSGNAIGAAKGASLLFGLAGRAGGDLKMKDTLKLHASMKKALESGVDVQEDVDDIDEFDGLNDSFSSFKSSASSPHKSPNTSTKRVSPGKSGSSPVTGSGGVFGDSIDLDISIDAGDAKKVCTLYHIGMADNQLDHLSGHGMAQLLMNNHNLTSVDISGNSLGYTGGVALADALERIYGIEPRDFFKQTLKSIEEKKYVGRNAVKRPVLYTNLTAFNAARNGLGADTAAGIMICLSNKNCTITDLDLSNNPLGAAVKKAGDAMDAAMEMRIAFHTNTTLQRLNISDVSFGSSELVALLGGVPSNKHLVQVTLDGCHLDEPCCLQLSHALGSCSSLTVLSLARCKMGPNGAAMVVSQVEAIAGRLCHVDLSDNSMGPSGAITLGKALAVSACTIKVLKVANNQFLSGGVFLVQGIASNTSLIEIDMSNNGITSEAAEALADVTRGYYEKGRRICNCSIRKIVVSDNPAIGPLSSRILINAFISSSFVHVGLANIGAGPQSAYDIARSMRDISLTWKYVDIGGNNICHSGLNTIFWAMRQNRSIRVLLTADNKAGPEFATISDSLLKHGIAFVRMIRSNVVLRELDLSYNGISADAGNIIFDAMIDNYSIRHLTLRGNHFDDTNASALGDLIRLNNVIDYLDLGENKLGYECSFSIAEGIEVNRSIRILCLDNNLLGNAGAVTASAFSRAIMMNTSLQTLVLDGNKLGPDWGINIAKAISRNNTLIQVSLRDNRLDHRAGQMLCNAYKHAINLLELCLSADEIGEVWYEFRKNFNEKRSFSRHINEINKDTFLSLDRIDKENEYIGYM